MIMTAIIIIAFTAVLVAICGVIWLWARYSHGVMNRRYRALHEDDLHGRTFHSEFGEGFNLEPLPKDYRRNS